MPFGGKTGLKFSLRTSCLAPIPVSPLAKHAQPQRPKRDGPAPKRGAAKVVMLTLQKRSELVPDLAKELAAIVIVAVTNRSVGNSKDLVAIDERWRCIENVRNADQDFVLARNFV